MPRRWGTASLSLGVLVVPDPLVMPIALDMLECYATEIARVENPPANVGLRPGSVVDFLLSTGGDNECCDGLAWVRPVSFFPSSQTFPDQDGAPLQSGVLAWAVVLELGAVRCAPTPDAITIPTSGQWNDVVQQVMEDAAAMRRAICCYINASPRRGMRVLPGTWTPLDVEGGCVGGTLTVTVRGPACDCTEEDS
jgi:hypothetical protein